MGDLITVFGDGLTQTISSVKEIIVVALQFGLPVGGLLLALTIGIKFFKHITGVDDALDAANANTDAFLEEYDDWIDNHPTY